MMLPYMVFKFDKLLLYNLEIKMGQTCIEAEGDGDEPRLQMQMASQVVPFNPL
jgi:hypothetical protein